MASQYDFYEDDNMLSYGDYSSSSYNDSNASTKPDTSTERSSLSVNDSSSTSSYDSFVLALLGKRSVAVDSSVEEERKPREDENVVSNAVVYDFFHYLEDLSKKAAFDIIKDIRKSQFNVDELFDCMSKNPAFLIPFMKTVKIICLSKYGAHRIEILYRICRPRLVENIRAFLGRCAREMNSLTIHNVDLLVNDLLEFYTSVVNLLPELAIELNFKELIAETMVIEGVLYELLPSIAANGGPASPRLQELYRILDNAVSRNDSALVTVSAETGSEANFRTSSLYLTREDLLNQAPCSLTNEMTGAFGCVEHYLAAHFGLIRENAIQPVIQGVQTYWNGGYDSDLKFYSNARFVGAGFHNKRFYYEVRLSDDRPPNRSQSVAAESCGFTFDSLLLFTNDNFATFFFAHVVLFDAAKNSVWVTVKENNVPIDGIFNSTYTMMDTRAPFDMYRRILKALLAFNERNFPLTRQLVHGDVRVTRPNYMRELDPGCHLRQLINSHAHRNWSLVNLNVNEHQLIALRAALCTDLTLIRCYPGTGKTHLASLLVKVFVQEMESYPHNIPAPVLMICSSNRALDEFLESVMKHTRAIVRMGGQPCRPAVAPYNLRDLPSPLYGNGMTIAVLKSEIIRWRRETVRVAAKIKEINKFEGVLSYDVLKTAMNDRHREVVNDDEKLLTWLLNEDEEFDVDDDEEYWVRYANLETAMETEMAKKAKIIERLAKDVAPQQSNGNSLKKDVYEKTTSMYGDRDKFLLDTEMVHTDVSVYTLTIEKFQKEYLAKVERMRETFQKFANGSVDQRVLYFALEDATMARRKLLNLEKRIKEIDIAQRTEKTYEQLTNNVNHVNRMCTRDRWLLYAFWVHHLQKELAETLVKNEREYRTRLDKYEKEADLRVMASALVIGTTVACASKFQDRLKALQPAIVIVEEATDIMEIELVTLLTRSVEHLILFGDPNMMKQMTEMSKYSRTNGADLSLFERLMNKGMNCYPLVIQHNVRPEITTLVSSLCDSELQNRETVDHEVIRGFAKSVFFVDHFNSEESIGTSKKNTFEAKFMLKLCQYLLYQGYSASRITVLTFYDEQASLLRKLVTDTLKDSASDRFLSSVLITTVDKFRNERSSVVLLSLVSSNNDGNIGILKEKSSIYTALTRAKEGLYIIGNMACLTKYSTYWTQIKRILEERNAIGGHIKLFCKSHNTYWHVAHPNDKWEGCHSICNKKLLCGHDCKYPCHLNDERHKEQYKCKEICLKKCGFGHRCTLPCSTSCEPCSVPLLGVSPVCKHIVKKACGTSWYEAVCTAPCDQILVCGHACVSRCHKFDDPRHKKYKCQELCGAIHKDCKKGHKCTKFCSERCSICLKTEWYVLDCGHRVMLPCSSSLDKIKCYEICSKICQTCGLPCTKYCYETCDPCSNMVKKKIEECGHEVLIECSVTPDKSICKTTVTLNNVSTLCGHSGLIIMPCRVKNSDPKSFLPYCKEPCRATLNCGHQCTGTCGSCLQGRLHKFCKQKCEKMLICGHRCSSLCDEECPPCNQPCTSYCKHNTCQTECGLPCTPCQEKCDWGCKHNVCTRKCGELCNRYPCFEPCELNLNCGHQCSGFCGDPCPTLCRICDKNNPQPIIFGFENDPDSRFVLLRDCNHVIESRGLDKYLSSIGCTDVFRKCPIPSCKQLILNTLRYKNYVKLGYKYLTRTKKIYFSFDEQMTEWKDKMKEKLSKFWKIYYFETELNKLSEIESYFGTIIGDEKHYLSKQQMKAMDFYVNVILDIGARSYDFGGIVNVGSHRHDLSGLIDIKCFSQCDEIQSTLENILRRLEPMSLKFNSQILQDIKFELNRFHRLVDYSSLLDSYHFKKYGNEPCASEICSAVQEILYGHRIFTDEENSKVKALLRNLMVVVKKTEPPVLIGEQLLAAVIKNSCEEKRKQ